MQLKKSDKKNKITEKDITSTLVEGQIIKDNSEKEKENKTPIELITKESSLEPKRLY